MEINIEEKLAETNAAIATLTEIGKPIPVEAMEIQEILRRCAAAERLVATNLESQLVIGKEAYEAYANHTGWKSLATGQPIPPWCDLSDTTKSAWNVAAAWVAGRVLRKFGIM